MIEDENIIENSRDLPVPDFNKKEVEEIAKAACVNKVDLDNPFEGLVEVDVSGLTFEEALAQGKLTSNADEGTEITQEQHDKIYVLLKKACADGKLQYDNAILLLNYFVKGRAGDVNLCFGCTTSIVESPHTNVGCHLEFQLLEDRYSCILNEV